MGRVFNKNMKRPQVTKLIEAPKAKIPKKEEELKEEEEDEEVEDEELFDEEMDEEFDDEEVEDEDEDEVDDEQKEELESDNGDGEEQILDFDFEGFPMEENDREGVVNMLTQTFLRTDIDLKEFADALIAQSPFGSVVGPADDEADEDNKNAVNGLCSAIQLNMKEKPKFLKDVMGYLVSRAQKSASKEISKKIEEIFEEGDASNGMFINERMLNFPTLIVPQIFSSIRTDIAGMDKPFKNVIYIQKIRVAEEKKEDSQKPQPSKSKKKMGKAEKKRLAAAALEAAEIEFDNPEDKLLFELKAGSETHFDFPVHMDVEPGSKFHIVEKKGKKWNPFRRVVIMDFKRFDAFLKKGMEGVPKL